MTTVSSSNDALLETRVFANRIEVVIAALQDNERLQHLVIPQLHDEIPFLEEKIPTLAEALCSPRCKVLDTMVIGKDELDEPIDEWGDLFPRLRTGPSIRDIKFPPFAADILSEIGKVLPQLCLRKLTVYGMPPVDFTRTIIKDFTIERLGKNYCMEEMNFYLTDRYLLRTTDPEGTRGLSELPIKYDFFLKLNRFHRRCGISRKDFVTNPESIPGPKWLDLFTALAKEEGDDVCDIYYYGHMALDWFSSLLRPDTLADGLAKTNKVDESPPKETPKLDYDTTTTVVSTGRVPPSSSASSSLDGDMLRALDTISALSSTFGGKCIVDQKDEQQKGN